MCLYLLHCGVEESDLAMLQKGNVCKLCSIQDWQKLSIWERFYSLWSTVKPLFSPRWATWVYMTEYLQYTWRSIILQTRKKTWASNFTPRRIPGIKIFYPKNTRLSTSILIYSIKRTLRPKKIHDRSPDPKKYRGCKFSTPQKYIGPPRHVYCKAPPPHPLGNYPDLDYLEFFSDPNFSWLICHIQDLYQKLFTSNQLSYKTPVRTDFVS